MISRTGKTGLSVGEVGCRQGKGQQLAEKGEESRLQMLSNSMLENLQHAEFACARSLPLKTTQTYNCIYFQ